MSFFLDFADDSDSDSDEDDSEDELEESEDVSDELEEEDESELESDEDEELDESEDVDIEPDFDRERFDRFGLVNFRGETVVGIFMRVTTEATDFFIGVSSDMYESSVLDLVCSVDGCLSTFLVPFF